MQIYVGNLNYRSTDSDIREIFEPFGTVDSVQVIMDKMTNRPRGFAFVQMPDAAQAKAAIDGLNGKDFQGRDLRVNEALPQGAGGGGGGGRPPRSGGGGRPPRSGGHGSGDSGGPRRPPRRY